MKLKNSTVLITGGTSGIGLEFVNQLTEIGANIIITGRNLDKLNDMKRCFPNVNIFKSDVTNSTDIKKLFQDVTAQFPNLNIIINNAGIMRQIDLQNKFIDLENINYEIITNLTGTIQMIHQFLPHLKKQDSAAIINITSSIAFAPYTIAPIYSAAKAGAHAYTKILRLQLQNTHVKVFEVLPPGVKTNLHNTWKLSPQQNRMMDVERFVRKAINGILNNRLEITPGLAKAIKIISRIAPNTLIKIGHGEFKKFKKLI